MDKMTTAGVFAVFLYVSACATTPIREPTFASEPIVVKVDEGAFNRGLQAAVRDGFKPTSVDSAGGFFSVEKTQVDQRLTAQKTAERVSVWGTPHTYYRRLTITAVVGSEEATIASSVVGCVDAKCGWVVYPTLNASEHEALTEIVSAFDPPKLKTSATIPVN